MTALKFNKVKNLPTSGYNVGDVFFVSSEKKIYIRTESGWEEYGGSSLTGLFDEIYLYTNNNSSHLADNVRAIQAYINKLTALGIDVTKGFSAPVRLSDQMRGTLTYCRAATFAEGKYVLTGILCYDGINAPVYDKIKIVSIDATTGKYYEDLVIKDESISLTTTKKSVVGAINEVNALAKSKGTGTITGIKMNGVSKGTSGVVDLGTVITSHQDISGKQDTLTSGTNIKTINGQSLLGSGDIAISGGSGDVTAAGDNTFTGNNIFKTWTEFKQGLFVHNENLNQSYYLAINTDGKFWISNTDDADVEVTGVDTPTQDNAAANKKYVDDKVAAAGRGFEPIIIDLDEISTTGAIVSTAIFNTLANAAIDEIPIFGYSKGASGSIAIHNFVPLSVKLFTGSMERLLVDFIASNTHYSINIMKASDNNYKIVSFVSHLFSLDTSVNYSSTGGIQSRAVWNEIHAEPMTVNTATSGVTILSSTDKHKILCYANSGTQQYNLPSSPVDGETFLFLKVKSGHTITIQSGTGNSNVYDCSSGNSVTSKTVASSTRRKITVTYSSNAAKWFLMADDFLS